MKPIILAVDDDPIILDIYQAILGKLYRLYVVSSGENALDFLKSGPLPDLVLLDIMMSGIDGYEVCQEIRQIPLLSHLKVILVSAKSMVNERLRGYHVGADDYITKPFEENELLAKIKVFLRLKNIEEMDNIKKNFLMLISHETRTPLNGIIGFTQLLRESPNLNKEEKEFVDLINKCGEDILQLSEKIILLSDLKSGNIIIKKDKINLNELLTTCQHSLTKKAKEKHLVLQIQSNNAAEIDGDPGLLQHAFEMVLDNAVKFAREKTAVEVNLNQAGTRIQVDIANDGEKIPEAHREDIFNEFFVQNIEKHHRGHGLSLATARCIVEAHEGTLSVKNKDHGPVFVFDIPSSLGRVPGSCTCAMRVIVGDSLRAV